MPENCHLLENKHDFRKSLTEREMRDSTPTGITFAMILKIDANKDPHQYVSGSCCLPGLISPVPRP